MKDSPGTSRVHTKINRVLKDINLYLQTIDCQNVIQERIKSAPHICNIVYIADKYTVRCNVRVYIHTHTITYTNYINYVTI